MATRGLDREAGGRAGGRWVAGCAGTLSLTDGQGRDCLPRGRKSRALIAFLVAQPGTRVGRETVMNMLWGDRAEQQARASLRQSLFEIKQAAGELVRSDRDLVWIEPDQIDFTDEDDEGEAFSDLGNVTPEFDTWLSHERARRSKSDWEKLRTDCERLLGFGRSAAALQCVERLQRLDPYNEDSVQLAMRAEFQAKRPAGIDRRFRTFTELLKTDLGIAPAAETRELRDRLLSELTAERPSRVPAAEASPAQPAEAQPPRQRVSPAFSFFAVNTSNRKILLAAIAATVLAAALFASWVFSSSNGLPVIAVAPADSSPRTQALARDLLVKLGTLPQIGDGRWQLVDAGGGTSRPTRIFRASESVVSGKPHANLVLLSAPDKQVLWARDFESPDGNESDLRQIVALTAARVLGCALDAGQGKGLPGDLTKLFLDGCAASAEAGGDNREQISAVFRTILRDRPEFTPAWALLLKEGASSVYLSLRPDELKQTTAVLRADAAAAARVAPQLPELSFAKAALLPPTAWAERLQIIEDLKTRFPENADAWSEYGSALQSVGRMGDSVEAARRQVDLDPLSPAAFSNLVMAMAAAGQIDAAKQELDRSERKWAGTGTLRDAQYGFHLRYGDPRIARAMANPTYMDKGLGAFFDARIDPSEANIDRFAAFTKIKENRDDPHVLVFVIQAFGAFHRTNDLYQWLDSTPAPMLAEVSYVLFRPTVAEARRDPRFMLIAQRIGLLDYWRKSGRWPDFCSELGLPYDCEAVAAQLTASGRT